MPAVFWHVAAWSCWCGMDLDIVMCAREKYVTSRLFFRFNYMYVYMPAYVFVHSVHAGAQGSQRGRQNPRTEVTSNCELSGAFSDARQDPLEHPPLCSGEWRDGTALSAWSPGVEQLQHTAAWHIPIQSTRDTWRSQKWTYNSVSPDPGVLFVTAASTVPSFLLPQANGTMKYDLASLKMSSRSL